MNEIVEQFINKAGARLPASVELEITPPAVCRALPLMAERIRELEQASGEHLKSASPGYLDSPSPPPATPQDKSRVDDLTDRLQGNVNRLRNALQVEDEPEPATPQDETGHEKSCICERCTSLRFLRKQGYLAEPATPQEDEPCPECGHSKVSRCHDCCTQTYPQESEERR